MIKSYIKTAWRNLVRNKVYALINIVGLSIGIAASLVIFLVVNYHWSFDKFENGGDRIYRVVSDMKFPDNDFKNQGVPPPLVPAVQSKLTGVDLFVPLTLLPKPLVSVQNQGKPIPDIFKDRPAVVYTNANYFKAVPYTWLAGDPETALKKPFSVVLTASAARAYFPGTQVTANIGKLVSYNDSIRTTVTGIVQDLNQVSDFTFKEFIAYASLPQALFTDPSNWGGVNSNDQLFIRLAKGSTAKAVTKQIQALFNSQQQESQLKNEFSLQPLSDVHFNSDYGSFDLPQAHTPTLYGLMVVALILLLLACFNFINLSTAQAVQRAKEIGIRKTMGGTKGQLMLQLLSETYLFSILAAMLSVCLIPVIIRLFAGFIPPAIQPAMLLTWRFGLFAFALVMVVGLLAGWYPATVLSGYKPVLVLKNQVVAGGGTSRVTWIRKLLTVTQFVFAQSFIIASLLVGTQIQFMLNKDLGFRKEGVVTMRTPFVVTDLWDPAAARRSAETRRVLLQRIKSLPEVAIACIAAMPPSADGMNMQTMKYFDGNKKIETTVEVKHGDEDYQKIYKLTLLAGSWLRKSDTVSEYVINASYARFLGFKHPADAIGKMMNRGDGNNGIPIAGVVADFHSNSLHSAIKPLVFVNVSPLESELHVLFAAGTVPADWKRAIGKMEKIYKDVYPGEECKVAFVDDAIKKFYEADQQTATLLNWASGLAIVVSCLGLLGLVMFATSLRTKEIGIRKVLGASVLQILTLLSKDFMKLVLLAFLIAVPMVWWGVHKWFEGFAYHTSVSLWLFVVAGFGMALIALITLSFQTIRAATANPVEALKTE